MRRDAREILNAAIDAVKPVALIQNAVSVNGNDLVVGTRQFKIDALDNIYVVAAGKAAAEMAAAFEDIAGTLITEGLAITKYQHGLPLKRIQCIEAGHPVPDKQGIIAAQLILDIAGKAKENDLFVLLLSGGASALIADLPEGIELEDMVRFSQQLLQSGANIHELNTIRKHLSVLKGGQLSREVWPASLVCLAISDVTGDITGSIGSGPTIEDESTFAEAWEIIKKYGLGNTIPDNIRDYLQKGKEGFIKETPKPGSPVFSRTHFNLIGNNSKALLAAASAAGQLNYHTIILDNQFAGNAEEEAITLFNTAKDFNGPTPACIIAGGETTVTVKGTGKVGRNQHMALTVLAEWIKSKKELPHLLFLSSATDGTDGPTDAAGAMVDEEFVQEVLGKGINVAAFQVNNDSYHFFKNTQMHIVTGPTQTNVMDIVIMLIVSSE